MSSTLLAQDIKWTDVMTAWGTVGAAVAAVVAAAIAVWVAGWLSPKATQRAADAAENRLRQREEQAEDRRFRSAALLVHDELRANLSILQTAQQSDEIPEPLAFQTYADHQLLLAAHLKPDDRDDVRAAYVYALTPRVFVRKVGMGPYGVSLRPLSDNIEGARQKTERAMVVLGWVANELPGGYKDL